MKASIVIPAYKPTSLLKGCIDGIIQNTDLTDVEVIVVCNGSDRDSADLVLNAGKAFKLVWSEEALGFTVAANIGLKIATGDAVILLNTDAHLLQLCERDTWINRLLNPLANPAVGVTGLEFMWTEFGSFSPFYCVGISRKLIDTIGLLDERFNPGYAEDADYCYRAKKAGFGVIQINTAYPDPDNPNMTINDFPIWHPGEQSFMDKQKRLEYVEKGYTLLREKWTNNI